ncbi:hypothetical protein [Actinomyces faecalis]|uniref:hypothetical protein n=1 Tax=Actinomyces faecalis TaxID=2722820 RepID=UPI001555DFE2|nr:hypothetical protein [Actinomyces faecalis]
MTTRRHFLLGAVTTAAAATLAACSQEVPATPSVTSSATPRPVLDADRLTVVLERIGKGLSAADSARNGEALAGYLTGPAARVRTAEYAVAQAAEDESLIHTFSATSQAGAVGLTTGFPRAALTITEPVSDSEPPYLLVLSQETARDSFELWAWARLFAGVEVPATSTASVGSEQAEADSEGLVATPEEVLAAYIELLNNPEGDNSLGFADDSLRQRVASERGVDLSGMGTVSVTATAGSDGFKGLRTTEGGALVATTLSFTTTYTKTVAGSTLNVGGNVGKLLGGDTEVRGTVTASYDVMIAFSVPSAEAGGEVVALGADLVLASAARDDAAAPQE